MPRSCMPRALLVQLGLGALAPRPRASAIRAFCSASSACALARRRPRARCSLGDALAARARAHARACWTRLARIARQHEREQRDDDQSHDDDGDDGAGGHRIPPFHDGVLVEGFPADCLSAMRADLRPAVALDPLRRRAAGRGRGRARRRSGRAAARADRPRHRRRRPGGAGGGARARHRASRPPPSCPPSHGEHEDLHILGYELDHRRRRRCSPRCDDFRGDRVRRIDAMADRLRELGLRARRRTARARRDAGKPIGRPHLADARARAPGEPQRLRTRGSTAERALPAVPGPRRRRATSPASRPTVPQAIEVIHAAGGVAVWAHPFWDLDDAPRRSPRCDAFVDAGLDGVECFYATHTRGADRARCTPPRASAGC